MSDATTKEKSNFLRVNSVIGDKQQGKRPREEQETSELEMSAGKKIKTEDAEPEHTEKVDYTARFLRHTDKVRGFQDTLDKQAEARCYAYFFRKFLRIEDLIGISAMLILPLAFGNPVFIAAFLMMPFHPQTAEFDAYFLTKLFIKLEYKEKSMLEAGIGLNERWYEGLLRGADDQRCYEGSFSALSDGIPEQEGERLLFGDWHSGFQDKRRSIKAMQEKADEFYQLNKEELEKALQKKPGEAMHDRSPIMDQYIREYLDPLEKEIDLFKKVYDPKVQAGLDSCKNKFIGASEKSRRLEKDDLTPIFGSNVKAASVAKACVNFVDRIAEWGGATRSLSAQKIADNLRELAQTLYAASLKEMAEEEIAAERALLEPRNPAIAGAAA
jgi:hypothetical protein